MGYTRPLNLGSLIRSYLWNHDRIDNKIRVPNRPDAVTRMLKVQASYPDTRAPLNARRRGPERRERKEKKPPSVILFLRWHSSPIIVPGRRFRSATEEGEKEEHRISIRRVSRGGVGGVMGDQLARGEELEKKAEKKLSGWSFFGNKHEDAADLFDKAANCYKLAKSCTIRFFKKKFYHISSFYILAVSVPPISCRHIFFSIGTTTMAGGWFRLNATWNQIE